MYPFKVAVRLPFFIIGLFVKFPNTQKRESHNDGILFFYTIDFSHSFKTVIFSPCVAHVPASADNMHYVNCDWSNQKSLSLDLQFLIKY